MAGIHVNDLKSNIESLSRAYLFNCYIALCPVPRLIGGESKTAYLVRSTSLPESTIDPIEVPWQGMMYKMGSTHTFTDFEITFNVDKDAEIREDFLLWQQFVHNPDTNFGGNPTLYMGEIMLELLDLQGDPTLQYILHQAWPTSVGALELAQDSKDVAQMSVTFTYNWHSFIPR